MTHESRNQQESQEAQLKKLIRKIDRHERFKRRAVAGALAGAAVLSPVAQAATNSYELAPLPDCDPFTAQISSHSSDATPAQKAARDLVVAPASPSSIVIQAILLSAGDEEKMREMDNALQVAISTTRNADSTAYQQSCALHDELRDISIFNPALYDARTYNKLKDDPANHITFQSLAVYRDADSDTVLRAYYEPTTGTVSIVSAGMAVGEGFERALGVITENTDRVIPYALAEQFVQELQRTILENRLQVNQTAIAAHSMGASGGILLKGMLESTQLNRLVFGASPSLTVIEGFGESLAAQTISQQLDIPMDKLTRNSASLRSLKDGEANMVAREWDTNHPIGERVYAVESVSKDTHALPSMAIGLLNGKNRITPYEGEFRADNGQEILAAGTQFLGKLAKVGRDVRETLGRG